jgi:hypothetical protein
LKTAWRGQQSLSQEAKAETEQKKPINQIVFFEAELISLTSRRQLARAVYSWLYCIVLFKKSVVIRSQVKGKGNEMKSEFVGGTHASGCLTRQKVKMRILVVLKGEDDEMRSCEELTRLQVGFHLKHCNTFFT